MDKYFKNKTLLYETDLVDQTTKNDNDTSNEDDDDYLQIYYVSDSDDENDNNSEDQCKKNVRPLSVPSLLNCKKEPLDSGEACCMDEYDDDISNNDNINVVINDASSDKCYNEAQAQQLQHVLNSSNIYSDIYIHDVALQKELSDLVASSVYPRSKQLITVNYNENLLLISSAQPLSSRMATLFWGNGLHYRPSQLPYLEQFYASMREGIRRGLKQRPQPPGISISDTYAIFSVKYRKHIATTHRTTTLQQQQNNQNYNGMRAKINMITFPKSSDRLNSTSKILYK